MEQSQTPDQGIQVTSRIDRLSQREQLTQYLDWVRSRKEPVRLRLPLALYNYNTRPQYSDVRDASWNLALPSAELTVEQIEDVIAALHLFMGTLGTVGAAGVMALLTVPVPPPGDEVQGG